jgi:hypothetical protein
VVGAPQGATILWDNAPVPENPFSVDRKGTSVKLEVRAAGYKPFVTTVQPSEDREIEVRLTEEEQPNRNRASQTRRSEKKNTEEPNVAPAQTKDAFKQTKGGMKFSDDFE